jgi:hypothetical protein
MPNSKYLNSLTPQQRKAVAQLKALLQEPNLALKWRLEVGRLVERLVPSGSPERYGRNFMTGLLGFLRRPLHFQAELYAARQVAACYSDADVAKLKDLRWCHLRWLAAVPDVKQRKELQRKCLKERWSCLRLSREIQRELGTRGRGGRRIRKPTNFGPAVSLREMTRLAERWAICHPAWVDESRGELRGSAKASAVVQRDLEAALEKLQQLEELVPMARKAIERHLAKPPLGKRPKRPKKRPSS